MNNYINKFSCLNIEHNYLSGSYHMILTSNFVLYRFLLSYHISISNIEDPDHTACKLSRPKNCLIWVCSVCQSITMRLYEVKVKRQTTKSQINLLTCVVSPMSYNGSINFGVIIFLSIILNMCFIETVHLNTHNKCFG